MTHNVIKAFAGKLVGVNAVVPSDWWIVSEFPEVIREMRGER